MKNLAAALCLVCVFGAAQGQPAPRDPSRRHTSKSALRRARYIPRVEDEYDGGPTGPIKEAPITASYWRCLHCALHVSAPLTARPRAHTGGDCISNRTLRPSGHEWVREH